jgi:hypothetical protein
MEHGIMKADHTRNRMMLLPDMVLENLPKPSPENVNTQTQDYDQDRLFFSVEEMLSGVGRAMRAEDLNKLYSIIQTLSPERVAGSYLTHFADVTSHIANAMRNFALAEGSKATNIPLKFNVFNASLSSDIVRFCLQMGILHYLYIAIDLLQKCFPTIKKLQPQIEKDPETEEEWLILDISLEGEVDTILDDYNSYTDKWVSSVPWPERQLIRLSYDIV